MAWLHFLPRAAPSPPGSLSSAEHALGLLGCFLPLYRALFGSGKEVHQVPGGKKGPVPRDTSCCVGREEGRSQPKVPSRARGPAVLSPNPAKTPTQNWGRQDAGESERTHLALHPEPRLDALPEILLGHMPLGPLTSSTCFPTSGSTPFFTNPPSCPGTLLSDLTHWPPQPMASPSVLQHTQDQVSQQETGKVLCRQTALDL